MIRKTYCKAGWLIDGTGGPISRDVLLEISSGKICSILKNYGKIKQESLVTHEVSLDFSNCTILPGLMDSHVHLAMSGTTDELDRRRQLENDYEMTCACIHTHLQHHFRYGIVAVRDGGDHHGYVSRFKTENPRSIYPNVRILAGGRAFHNHGRYGRLIGRTPSADQTLSRAVADDPEPKDHVKIVNSGLNSLKEFGRQTACQFDSAELKEAVFQAAQKGLGAMIHANGILPVKASVEAGCRSVEHGFFMGADNLRRMADHGTTWVPTAVTMAAYLRLMRNDSPERMVVQRNLDHQLEQMAEAKRLGVPIALGTDAGSPGVHHGRAVREELSLLMRAGYSVEEALKCATVNAARLLGLEDGGRIAVGSPACFIAVQGAPAGIPESLSHVRAIYMDGQLRYEAVQRA